MIAFYKDGLEALQMEYDTHAIDKHGYIRRLREPKRFVHYYYPLSALREEVYKRTSLIGKHRANKDGNANRLDDVALTQDESDAFDYIASDAAHEVFEKIIAYTDDKVRSFIYNDGADNTVKRKENNGNSLHINALPFTSTANSVKCAFECVLDTPLKSNEQFALTFGGAYEVRNFMGIVEKRTFVQDVTVPYANADDGKTQYQLAFEFFPKIDDKPSARPGINAEIFEGATNVHLDSFAINFIVPKPIPSNFWIEYLMGNGERRLYYSTAPSDMNADLTDHSLYIDLTKHDLRYSIHYVVNKPIWVRENSVGKTDRSIFEALVAYIMYKWFSIVMPEEAEYYANEYERRLTDVKYNLAFCERMSVNSHPF